MCLIHLIAGASRYEPEELDRKLGAPARRLIDRAFADVDPGSLRDYHAHVVGFGTDDSGMWVNPNLRTWRHPLLRLRTSAYMSGARVTDDGHADAQYTDRLARLIRGIESHGKTHLLAFDHYYNADGTIDLSKSSFHTPNEFVCRMADEHPDVFAPTISVHPYRPDALEELERWALHGARFVKWLPNAQGMDASDERCDDFYRLMKRHDMTLLAHTGEEQAVAAADDQALGNPLLFRRPLEMGVRVIMAHCASLGQDEDLDHPGRKARSFDLFLRLMDDPRYEGLLYGDLSAMTQFNRLPGPMQEILRREDLHDRLVDGSDYPLPAINLVIQTRAVVRHGLITREEGTALNEIYHCNPLLFDYVLKRSLRHPGTGTRLSSRIFKAREELEGGARLQPHPL